MARHVHTDAPATGMAQPSGRAKSRLWDLTITPKPWAPPLAALPRTTPTTAVLLELRTAKGLARLSQRLAELAKEHGAGKVRALTFERWRFAAMQEEAKAAAGSKKMSKQPMHAVLPSGTHCKQANTDLVAELQRQGVRGDAATKVVQAFVEEAARLSGLLTT
eukprot:CAMPEP_0174737990 /NCGR_PEP_ID=MMETSP1094-20130205/69191_1 /TAXON_ID=156173 /ORGANISM="Chrysochromulina brevifilum, Strain UTEX LB 985" /LENGTH=162 /DNA_ID=CAMNT_0015941319 /DNA_START=19 /DNA_END=503 /DNA_ORIENTATION=+